MNLLLDTHVLLWAAGGSRKLPAKSRKILLDDRNNLFFSPANLWEIVIKRGLRDDFKADPHRFRKLLIANGYRELAVTSEHVLAVDRLPALHKDPFDRILLAQARSEGMLLLTADSQIIRYGEGVVPAR